MELTERHWEILYFLREYYARHGVASSARILLKALEDRFCAGTGKRRLYKLFPGGPVTQGGKITGRPLPPHHSDPSFGSVT
ncbi:MAG TPA: hypothetical protein DEP05_01200 [Betaproteobacteria bacterium]|nr:hypothetical protein [Betaproteobacteria bacterium]